MLGTKNFTLTYLKESHTAVYKHKTDANTQKLIS